MVKKYIKWILAVLIIGGISIFINWFAGLFLSENPAIEPDYNMYTDDYQVDVEVLTDNSYLITETITVELYNRHGIYRYVPIMGFVADTSGNRMPYEAELEIESCNVPVDGYTEDEFYVMRLGDEYVTVNGKTTYELSYHLIPNFQEEFNWVYYNIFPTAWQNSIPEGSTFTISFPKKFDHDILKMVYGSYGSAMEVSDDIVDAWWEDNTLTGTLKTSLGTGEGLTVWANVGEGYFDSYHEETDYNVVIIMFAVLVLIILGILFLLFGRDEKIIPSVQFQPPEGLDSAAVGYIIDGETDNKDILSLILYWADKGYLKIIDGEKGVITLVKKQELPESVPGYQKKLFNKLFEKKRNQVTTDDLEYKCAGTIEKCKSGLRKYIRSMGGVYTRTSKVCRGISMLLAVLPMAVAVLYVVISSRISELQMFAFLMDLLLVLIGIIVFSNAVDRWYAVEDKSRRGRVFVGIALMAAGTLGFLFSYLTLVRQRRVFDFFFAALIATVITLLCGVITVFMRKRSKVCVEWMGWLAGLRDFIEMAELDRMKALADTNPEWFYNVMPYAYVFGLTDVFAKKLEGLAIPAPDWYESSGGGRWDYYSFNRHMMRSMDTITRTATAVKTTSQSSGGGFSGGGFSGGGGGFSGGGFGGGGGGSW